METKYSRRIVKTKIGLLKRIYYTQVAVSKKRNHQPPKYSLNDFINRYINDEVFILLFDNWAENKYDISLKPSCDRLNDYIGYSFDNIQFITWSENDEKYKKSERKKEICRKIKKSHIIPIAQYNIDNTLKKVWINGTDDIKNFFKSINNIRAVCRNDRNQAYGYLWKYIKNKSELKRLMPQLNIPIDGK